MCFTDGSLTLVSGRHAGTRADGRMYALEHIVACTYSVHVVTGSKRTCSCATCAQGGDCNSRPRFQSQSQSTCSAARGIPVGRSPGPPVLRTCEQPWGLPNLRPSDALKVEMANALYKRLCAFLHECSTLGLPWVVENPTNSLWQLPCFQAIAEGNTFAHCEACAFGSSRRKKTSFLSNFSAISRMARLCPGCVTHAPWGADAEGRFHTAEEAAYPKLMCSALCDVFDQFAEALQLPLGSCKPVVARASTQPRGRLRPQVVSEYLRVQPVTLPALPALDSKQSLKQAISSIPAGSKLLRSEKKGDGSFLCIFGVYRTPVQFLDEARKLWHPYDTMAQMPDYLIRCIFEQLTLSPLQLSKLRIERLKLWKSWSEELRPRDRELKAALHPMVRRVLEGKNLALMERLMETMDWPDKNCLTEMMNGFRLVGRANTTGLFRPGLSLGSIEEDELMAMAPALKASILDRISAEDPGEHAQELLDISREEASVKGWLRGPRTPSEVDGLLGTSDWIPVRRFAVVQNSRARPIDDLRENHVNAHFDRQLHGSNGLPQCSGCGQAFERWADLQKHIQEHHCQKPIASRTEDMPHVAPLSYLQQAQNGTIAQRLEDLAADQNTCEELRNHCAICRQWMPSEKYAKQHWTRVHDEHMEAHRAATFQWRRKNVTRVQARCGLCGACTTKGADHRDTCPVPFQFSMIKAMTQGLDTQPAEPGIVVDEAFPSKDFAAQFGMRCQICEKMLTARGMRKHLADAHPQLWIASECHVDRLCAALAPQLQKQCQLCGGGYKCRDQHASACPIIFQSALARVRAAVGERDHPTATDGGDGGGNADAKLLRNGRG